MNLQFHEENLSKHGIKPEEVEECFSDVRRLVRRIGEIYWLIGRTEAGRLLQIGYRRDEDKTYFVFHAMAARAHELKRYKSRGK